MTADLHFQEGRRRFLAGLAGVAAGAVLPGCRRETPTPPAGGRIDVHHHFVSPRYVAALSALNAQTPLTGFANLRDYSIDRTLESMETGGIAAAGVSVTAPGASLGDADEARALARDLNEYAAARLVADHPGRFGLFAVLPLPDIDGSLREIEYAFDTLGADGVGLLTSYENRWLGDPFFTPVFDELDRRRAVVYTHPTDAVCCRGLMPGVANTVVEYNTDTSRAIVSLLMGGGAERHANTTFIFSHAGGTITALTGRLLGGDAPRTLAGVPEPGSTLHHLRRFYYDTAASTNPVNLQALRTLVTASQIVFGTDIPYGDPAALAASLAESGFTPDELRGVERENALRFLPRFGI